MKDVQKAKPGDTLRVGLADGAIGEGTVVHLDDSYLEMEVLLHQSPPEPLPLTLLLALPRPKVFRRVLRSAASMGVKRIYLLNSSRVEKSFWQTPFLSAASIKEQLVLGLEQSRDTLLPKTVLRERFKPFVEDELPEIARGTIKLVAHPSAQDPCPASQGSPITLAIGPEGGFVDYEVEKFVSAGFRAVGLGRRILSVETAVPFLISRLF